MLSRHVLSEWNPEERPWLGKSVLKNLFEMATMKPLVLVSLMQYSGKIHEGLRILSVHPAWRPFRIVEATPIDLQWARHEKVSNVADDKVHVIFGLLYWAVQGIKSFIFSF